MPSHLPSWDGDYHTTRWAIRITNGGGPPHWCYSKQVHAIAESLQQHRLHSLCVWCRLVGIFENELLKLSPPPFLGSHLVSIHCHASIMLVNIPQLILPYDFEYYIKLPSWIDPVSVWIYRASVDKWMPHLSSCLWVSVKTVLPDHLIGQMPLNLIVTLFTCVVNADVLSMKSCT